MGKKQNLYLDKETVSVHNIYACGRLAHLVEYRFDVARVIGSIPITTTKKADSYQLSAFFIFKFFRFAPNTSVFIQFSKNEI